MSDLDILSKAKVEAAFKGREMRYFVEVINIAVRDGKLRADEASRIIYARCGASVPAGENIVAFFDDTLRVVDFQYPVAAEVPSKPSDPLASLLTFEDEINMIKEQRRLKSKAVIEAMFAEFFKNVPEVGMISWTQYTPYFNDGDECTFRCNGDYFTYYTTAEIEEDRCDFDDEGGCFDQCWERYYPDHYEAAVSKLADGRLPIIRDELDKVKRMFHLDDEVFLDTFGNHVRVIATPHGIDADEYEHD